MSEIEIVRDPDVIAGFTEDASGLVGSPTGVVRPRDLQDVEEAVASHPDPEGIPERNMARLEELGLEGVRGLL